MNTSDLKKLLADNSQQFAAVLEQCRNGDFGDPAHTALAISKLTELIQSFQELQEQLVCPEERPEDR